MMADIVDHNGGCWVGSVRAWVWEVPLWCWVMLNLHNEPSKQPLHHREAVEAAI
jgi:hypothetical protein